MSNTNNNKIKICILEMSSQNKAILEFFFDNSGKSLFEETSLDSASTYIIDYDYPEAKDSVDEIRSSLKIPGMIISIKEVDLPDTVWIAKPLTIKALTSAKEQMSKIIFSLSEKEKNSRRIQNKVQEKKDIEEALSLDADENKLNIDLQNFDTSEIVKTESIKAKKENIHNKNTIDTTAPVLAGFEDSSDYIGSDFDNSLSNQDELDLEQENTNKIEQKDIEVPAANTNDDIDDLLKQLIATDIDDGFETSNSSSSENPVERTENTNNDELSFLDFDTEVVEKEVESKGILDQVNDQLSLDTISDIDNGSYLDLDFPEKNNTEAELNSTSIEAINIDNTSKESKDETITQLRDQIASLSKQEASTSTDNLSKEYFETVIDNAITDLPTDDTFVDLETVSVSKEIKAESILDQVNDQLNSDLLDLDTFSINDEVESDNTLIDSENFENKNTRQQPDKLSISLDDQIAELAEMGAVSSTDNSDENYYETIVDKVISELPTDDAYDVEPELSTSTDKAIENNNQVEETVVPQKLQTTSTETVVKLSAEDELQSLLDEIRVEAESKNPTLIRAKSEQGEASHHHTLTFAEERWALTCGDINAISNKQSLYNSRDCMLSTLLKVIEQSKSTEKVMRLKLNNIMIVVMPDIQTIYCDMSIYNNSYAEICFNPISQENIKIHYLDSSEIRLYRKIAKEESEFSHSIEAFIWTTSLLSSRGRLPQGTDVKKIVALKYWPDLTRIENIPHVMQIAAVFYKHPGCLQDIPGWLGVDKRYVYAFYNAILSLKLIELDQKQLSLASHKNGAFKKTKNRGFFSRLLKRINT